MIQDDNKIIFDKPQNFYRDTTRIKNDVIRKVIAVNNKIQYYACVTDITYADGEITANLLGRDDEEYEISITAEISEGEVYPSYLAVDSTKPTYIQAVQIVILEGLRLLTDDDNTLPEAEEINTLQATITQLEKDLDDAGDTITTLTGQVEALTGQLEAAQDTNLTFSAIDIEDIEYGELNAAVASEKINGGQVKLIVDDSTTFLYDDNSAAYVTLINSMVEFSDLKINDTDITISQATSTNSTGAVADKLTWIVNFSTSGTINALENNTISIKFKNKNTNYTRTINGTFTITETTIGEITTTTPTP